MTDPLSAEKLPWLEQSVSNWSGQSASNSSHKFSKKSALASADSLEDPHSAPLMILIVVPKHPVQIFSASSV